MQSSSKIQQKVRQSFSLRRKFDPVARLAIETAGEHGVEEISAMSPRPTQRPGEYYRKRPREIFHELRTWSTLGRGAATSAPLGPQHGLGHRIRANGHRPSASTRHLERQSGALDACARSKTWPAIRTRASHRVFIQGCILRRGCRTGVAELSPGVQRVGRCMSWSTTRRLHHGAGRGTVIALRDGRG